jgi:SEC-C motif
MKTTCAFEITSKRRKGFPSESGVKRGDRVVRGTKELVEKLGRNDPCPCGSARSFQTLLPAQRLLLTVSIATTTSADRPKIERV